MAGPFENLGDPPGYNFVAGTITSMGLIATVDQGAAHGFSDGDGVLVTGAIPSAYNGKFTVKSISPNTFIYEMASDPGVSSAMGSPFAARIWQTRRLLIENNVIELAFLVYPYAFGQPSGLWVAGSFIDPVYHHHALVVRDNIVRHNDNLFDPSGAPFAIVLSTIRRGVIESNTINLRSIYPAPIVYNNSAALKFFNNQTTAGNLEQGYDNVKMQRAPDLAVAVEDTMILAL